VFFPRGGATIALSSRVDTHLQLESEGTARAQ